MAVFLTGAGVAYSGVSQYTVEVPVTGVAGDIMPTLLMQHWLCLLLDVGDSPSSGDRSGHSVSGGWSGVQWW